MTFVLLGCEALQLIQMYPDVLHYQERQKSNQSIVMRVGVHGNRFHDQRALLLEESSLSCLGVLPLNTHYITQKSISITAPKVVDASVVIWALQF